MWTFGSRRVSRSRFRAVYTPPKPPPRITMRWGDRPELAPAMTCRSFPACAAMIAARAAENLAASAILATSTFLTDGERAHGGAAAGRRRWWQQCGRDRIDAAGTPRFPAAQRFRGQGPHPLARRIRPHVARVDR